MVSSAGGNGEKALPRSTPRWYHPLPVSSAPSFVPATRVSCFIPRFMNKYRPTMIPRVDPREDGSKQVANITKFLTACSSQGMPSDDLFYRDDLIDATPETLCRVARTIIGLPKLFEPPTVGESKILTGEKRADVSGAASDMGLFSLTSQSRLSPSESHAVPDRKQCPPAGPTFPLLRSDSPSGTSCVHPQLITRFNYVYKR